MLAGRTGQAHARGLHGPTGWSHELPYSGFRGLFHPEALPWGRHGVHRSVDM